MEHPYRKLIRKTVFILMCLLPAGVVFAQNVNIQQADSLIVELKKATRDTSRAIILADLAEAYRTERPDSTLYFADQALELSRQIKFPYGEMRAYLVLCFYFQMTGTDLPKALETGLKALDIAEKHGFRDYEGACLIRIGQVNLFLGNIQNAYSSFQRANKVLSGGNYPFFYAVTYWWLATTYLNMKKPDSALYMAKVGYDKALEINNNRILGQVLKIMGTVYKIKKDYPRAKEYYLQSIAAAERFNELVDVASGYLNLAGIFIELKQNDSAIFYSRKAFEIGRPRSSVGIVANAGFMLSGLLEQTDPAEALRYLKIANAAKDSVYNTQKIQSAQALLFNEKERKTELGFEKKAYQSRVRQYALSAGIALLMIMLAGLYRNNRNKQKANFALAQEKRKVEETLTELKSTQWQLIQKEKMASLGELTAGIAHEIQNPLNFVNNFTEVNQELIEEAGGARQEAGENSPVVGELLSEIQQNLLKINHHGKRADAIVKSMLQHSRTGSGHKEPTAINSLCDEYLRLAFHGMRARDKSFHTDLKTDFDPGADKVNVISQDLSRVLLNLYNNAFYAVWERKMSEPEFQPCVTVRTSRNGKETRILVTDNGQGIPEKIREKIFQPFFTTKPPGSGTGLGLSLAYDIVKAHGGEITVDSIPGVATTFTVSIPSPAAAGQSLT